MKNIGKSAIALGLILTGTAAVFTQSVRAAEISDGVVKIGVLSDMSGPYSSIAGKASVTAAEMAIKDFGGKVRGMPIELVSADHQNKPDIGSAIARRWIDSEKVDVIVDLVNSAVGLAVMQVAKQKDKAVLMSGTLSGRAVNEECNATTVQGTSDTYALSKSMASALVKEGKKKWFFITVDNAFGRSLEKDAGDTVKALGGKVLGAVKHPLDTVDFSSYLLSAQSSGADVVALANAGDNTVAAVKQAAEFRITPNQTLAALDAFLTDTHAIGLELAKDLYVSQGYYWDFDDRTREWSKRFFALHGGMPTVQNAAIYSMITNALKAIDATGSDSGIKIIDYMKSHDISDFYGRNAKLRANGSLVHDMFLFKVKSPQEKKYDWDYYKIQSVIPGDEAFPPLADSNCPLLK